jgi:ribosomal protein S18 acetylase RimI-like enzyme
MNDIRIRQAGAHDLEVLLPLVAAYHAFEKVTLSEAQRRRTVADLLADPTLGLVLRLDVSGAAAGYAAVCFGYSIEFGGRDAFLDELYLVPEVRHLGLGTRLLAEAKRHPAASGVRALHLEVDPDNAVAQRLYALNGFELRGGFKMMSVRLGGDCGQDDRRR